MKKEKYFHISYLYYPFLFSLIYWAFLLFNTEIVIANDGKGYLRLGEILNEQGVKAYFSLGVQREILYPALIALSNKLSGIFHVSFDIILKIFQFLLLFLTQILVFLTLKKLNVRKIFIFLGLMYIGISPSLTNTALGLWSENLVLPLNILLVLCSVYAWQAIRREEGIRFLLYTFGIVFIFILLISVKAIYQYVFWLYCCPFVCLALFAFCQRRYTLFKKALMLCVCTIFCVQAYVFTYKSINRHFNGNFEITNRKSMLLMGNSMKRVQPLTWKKVTTNLAASMGDQACNRFFNKSECDFWSFQTGLQYWNKAAINCRNNGFSGDQFTSCMMRKTKQTIWENPFSYSLFTFLESFKIFFWESTRIGYVVYPDWLNQVYLYNPLKNGLRLLMAFLTFLGLCIPTYHVYKNRKEMMSLQKVPSEELSILFFSCVMIGSYMLFHCLVTIIIRYITPIVPLLIVFIFYSLNNIFLNKRSHTMNRKEVI